MVGVEHQQRTAAHAVKMDARAHPLRQHPPLRQLDHLGTGRNAPETPSAGMDAAVACIPAVCSNAPHSVAVSSSPTFARPYEQPGHVSRSRVSIGDGGIFAGWGSGRS